MNRQKYWLYGTHAAQAALNNEERIIHRIWLANESLTDKLFIPKQLLKLVEITGRKPIDNKVGEEAVHQGVALQVDFLPEVYVDDLRAHKETNQCVLVLDQATDPHNVGAILRSAAAFGAKAVILTERNAPNESGVLAKTASGALEVVPLIREVNLARALETLKEMGFWCYGFAEGGKDSLPQCKLTGKTALVMGAEGKGLRRLTKDLCDVLVTIPTADSFSTLNVSNAAAVALYEVFRQT